MKFKLAGDILHAGFVEVEADTIDDAIAKAEDSGQFVVLDSDSKNLGFKFSGPAFDEEGKEIA